jgi:uncharacterized membrane protein HdeD (DUF308 family)
MKIRSTTPIKAAKTGYIILSSLLCAFGLLLIIFPTISLQILTPILGIMLIIFGIGKIAGYFSKDLYRLAFQFDLQFGILMLVLGIIILARPFAAINVFLTLIGITILAEGLFKIKTALDTRQFGISYWWMILVLAIIAGIVGILIVICPSESAVILTIFLGISLLAEGLLNLCVVISTVKIIKNQYSDVIDGEFNERG